MVLGRRLAFGYLDPRVMEGSFIEAGLHQEILGRGVSAAVRVSGILSWREAPVYLDPKNT